MSMDLTVTDLFCGAGGSSQGAVAAGARLAMAANHWQLAIETHSTNFPDAEHDCADVSQVEPRRYPRTDILLASPECTHHSQARSHKHHPDLFNPKGDPSAERSRATMWDVVRFAEIHQYEAIVVENVVEVSKWAPFNSWLGAMDSLGYQHKLISLNSMVAAPKHGSRAPQSRDRLYVAFWRAGNRKPDLDIRVQAYCDKCDKVVRARQGFKQNRAVGKYRQQYAYFCGKCHMEVAPMVSPAANAIDWAMPCPRIGDRDRPLAEATLRRIQTGLERFGPAIVQNAGHTYERPGYVRAWPVSEPLKAQTATLQHGIAVPAWMVSTIWSDGERPPRDLLLPFPTQTGRADSGIAFHPAFIAELKGGSCDVRTVTEPISTVAASGNHHGLVLTPSFYVKNYGPGDDPTMVHPLSDPLGSVTTADSTALVALPFISTYHGSKGETNPVDRPMPTQTGTDRHALVMPDYTVEDCGFRMLEPHEIQRGMAFADEYQVLGSKRDRVKQLGNAVTPPAMASIVERMVASLA